MARSDEAGSTRLAVSATLHCLTGCAIGEVLGMVIGTALGWGDLQTIALAVVLAFFFGYGLTVLPLLRGGLPLRAAVPIALAADTLSITVMEIVDNAIMLTVPGAMEAGLTDGLFWGALAFALLVAFMLTVPVNRWLIVRGRGHAAVHGMHEGHEVAASGQAASASGQAASASGHAVAARNETHDGLPAGSHAHH